MWGSAAGSLAAVRPESGLRKEEFSADVERGCWACHGFLLSTLCPHTYLRAVVLLESRQQGDQERLCRRDGGGPDSEQEACLGIFTSWRLNYIITYGRQWLSVFLFPVLILVSSKAGTSLAGRKMPTGGLWEFRLHNSHCSKNLQGMKESRKGTE